MTHPPHSEETKRRARELRESGMSHRAIARQLRVSDTSVRAWCDPELHARQLRHQSVWRAKTRAAQNAQRQAQRAALKQQQFEKEMAKQKTAVAEAYALIRRAAQALDHAERGATTFTARRAVRDALAAVHAAEDATVRASREWTVAA